jgi:hypothetical protein
MKNSQNRINIFILIISLLLSGCNPSAEEIAATETKIAAEVYGTQTATAPTTTPNPSPTSTIRPTSLPYRRPTLAFRATSTAQPMANLVHKLYDDGYLLTTQGKYLQLDDFEQSLAQINWVLFEKTEIYLSDFVLRSNIAWETARKGANINYSGCGFQFGFQDDQYRYHLILLTLGGNVRFQRCIECRHIRTIASNYFGKIDYMQGDAELIIVVEGDTIQAFVNGEQIFIRLDQYKFRGTLGYAVSSGINTGFGTRCIFTNTEIWSLEP